MHQRKRRTIALTALALAGLGAGSIGIDRSGAHASVPARPQRAMTNVKFILNWIPNVEFAGLWVAQKKGWWRRAGINMSYIPYSVSVRPETDVAARGGNTFGFQSAAALVIARAKGVQETAVFTDTQRSIFGLTVLASSKIYKLTDLKGKRVGYQPHEFYVPATMLASAGMKPTDWKPVVVGYSTDQLTQGQVDAYLSFLNNEPIALRLKGVKVRTFAASDFGFRAYDDVMFTTDNLIRQNPALVRKVTSIVARGFAWAHRNVRQATNITLANAPASFKLERMQQLMEMKAFDRFSRDSRGDFSGRMNATTWRGTINTLFRYRQITRKPAPGAMFTNQFNPFKR